MLLGSSRCDANSSSRAAAAAATAKTAAQQRHLGAGAVAAAHDRKEQTTITHLQHPGMHRHGSRWPADADAQPWKVLGALQVGCTTTEAEEQTASSTNSHIAGSVEL